MVRPKTHAVIKITFFMGRSLTCYVGIWPVKVMPNTLRRLGSLERKEYSPCLLGLVSLLLSTFDEC